MRKILWMIISGISLSLIPAMAQFNTVSSASDYYREESVQAATKDKETASDNTGSGKGVSENTGKSGARGDVQRQMVVERYLSVSYPLPRIKVTSPYGYRKDPFTGKRKFHGGIDLQARGDKVLAMMAGTVVKVGQDKTSGKYVTLQHGNCMISYCHLSMILVDRGTAVMRSLLPALQPAARENPCISPAASMARVSIPQSFLSMSGEYSRNVFRHWPNYDFFLPLIAWLILSPHTDIRTTDIGGMENVFP